MPAKILNTFTDENPELRKQFGCMTGILQMFHRHHLLSGRRLNDHNHKRNSSGHNLSNSKGYREVYNSASQQNSLNENRRVSIDSSRASFSSSSSSSSSSFFDCNKSTQHDAAPFDRTIFQEQSLKGSLNCKAYGSDVKSNPCSNCQPATVNNVQQHHDLRNVVKDSMQRDNKNLPVIKTLTWEEERDQAAKQRNSLKLPFLSKATEGTCANGIDHKPKASEDLNESIRVLLKLKQAPLSFSEYATKDSSHQVARQSPRFSCDEREYSRRMMDSRGDCKAIAAKLGDLPRLSLDSRERSLRSSNLVSRANTLMEDLNRTATATTTPRFSSASCLHEDPGSNKRPPGVVAKLMGLEELPNSWSSTAQEPITKKMNGSVTSSPSAKSFKSVLATKENQVCDSPKSSIKDSSLPKTKVRVPSVKQNSRITTEAAPWIQQERGRVDRRTAVGCPEAKTKQRTASVYSEIVKKLEELQFQQSNKDLRALKQILDVMHPKALSETTKEEEHQPSTPTQGYSRDQNPARKDMSKSSNSPRAFQSPIAFLKPAKSVSKSGVPPIYPTGNLSNLPRLRTSGSCDRNKGTTSKTDKDQSPRVSPRLPNVQVLLSSEKQLSRHAGEISAKKHRSNPAQTLMKHQHCVREDNGRSSAANSCSVSPRVQQRRAEAEKMHYLPNAFSELSKDQKLAANKHQVESVSPRGKIRLKQTQSPRIADKANESSTEAMNSIRTDRSREMKSAFLQQGLQSPSSKPFRSAVTSLLNQKNSLPIVNECAANKEILSPVSVLDTSFYKDFLPNSPVKRTLNKKDDETIDNYGRFTVSPDSKPSKLSSVINFVQEDRRPSSTVGQLQATDSMISECDTVNPDHKYITEMLLAMGLLQEDLNIGSKCRFPVQSYSPGQAINPDLFYVLEQMKQNKAKSGSEKSRRKLIFDAVNQILARKLELCDYDNRLQFLIQEGEISRRSLLQEVCSDIDHLQAQCSKKSGSMLDDDHDAMTGEVILHETTGWTDFRTERHEMVLEVERLIFKDLISDIIGDVTWSRQANCKAICLLNQ